MSFVIVGADKVEGVGRSVGQQTPGWKSTLGAGLIGQEIVAGRSVGDCSRMVSGSSTWLWSALLTNRKRMTNDLFEHVIL